MPPQIQNLDRLVRDIPAMSAVAQKVLQMINDPSTTNADLGEALASDQSLASRVLQMANSPVFALRQKVSSISNAVFVLGHGSLQNLVVAVCTKGLFKNPGLLEVKCWEHSLGAAVAARELARITGRTDPEESFLGGLLHDIGRTILLVSYRDAYREIFAEAYNENRGVHALIPVEKEEFGYDHCEIGSRVIRKWRLPNFYARIARRHHSEDVELIEKEDDPAALAIAAQANLIAHRLGLGRHAPDDRIDLVSTPYARILSLKKGQVLDIVVATWNKYKESRETFSLD